MIAERRIAVSLEMPWHFKYHQDTYVGTQDYARQRSGLECYIDPYPEQLFEDNQSRPGHDGIIARATRSIAAAARKIKLPLVNVWHSSPANGKVLTVTVDHVEVGRMAARHLIARGFRHFCFIGVTYNEQATRHMFTGFSEVVRQARRPLNLIRVPVKFDENAASWKKFRTLLEEWIPDQTLPVGILCDRDLLTRYVTNALVRGGIDVPHEAALIGAGNDEVICNSAEPSLSSIELGYARVGFHAARLLDRIIGGEKISPRTIFLSPGELFPRQSTDAQAVENDLVAAALRFIANESHNQIRVRDVAAAVNASCRTLERRFKEAMNRTVVNHINQQRVERAKRHLVDSENKVKDIARECGFYNGEQMCHVFTRVVGISPIAFRKQSRKHSFP